MATCEMCHEEIASSDQVMQVAEGYPRRYIHTKCPYTGTVRWFGPTWNAPVNDPRAEISVPLGENCIECQVFFDHGDSGIAIVASPSIAENGQVFYHLTCFTRTLGIDHVVEKQEDGEFYGYR